MSIAYTWTQQLGAVFFVEKRAEELAVGHRRVQCQVEHVLPVAGGDAVLFGEAPDRLAACDQIGIGGVAVQTARLASNDFLLVHELALAHDRVDHAQARFVALSGLVVHEAAHEAFRVRVQRGERGYDSNAARERLQCAFN